MSPRVIVAFALLASCGRVGFAPIGASDAQEPPADATLSVIEQQAYVKASNTGAGDLFGWHIAVSADGSTLAAGAYLESSAATGIDGSQADNSAMFSGAVYVFTRTGTTWTQQAYIKASNTDAGDRFGYSLALSADGATLAVGSTTEASVATGIGGNQTDNSAFSAGAVYVLTRNGALWSQQAYVKASNTDANDQFGASVTLSADGATLAVGAPAEDSVATGIDGNQNDDSIDGSGAVYVFTRAGSTWTQQAYVKASNPGLGDNFGWAIALAADGATLAVSAHMEDSGATGIGGSEADNSSMDAGAVYMFIRSGATWTQQAYVKASASGAGDRFGDGLAVSADGSTLVVGAPLEDSAATGVDGDQADNTATNAGATYVFTRAGNAWTQQAYLKASTAGADDAFGDVVTLSDDGSTLVIGTGLEDSAAIGISDSQAVDTALSAGAGYVFARAGTTWSQQAFLKASNTDPGDRFAASVALSADGGTLAVAASREDSETTGIGGNQADNESPDAGAVYVFSMRNP